MGELYLIDYFDSLLDKYEKGELFEPLILNLLITNRCNLNCKHCFNWEANNNAQLKDLIYEEYVKIASSAGKIGMVMVAGGEPFLRDDLPEIVDLFVKTNEVQSFGFATNGFDMNRTVTSLERILNQNPQVSVGVAFSIDGPKEIHNFIRNNDKAFSNAMATWAEVKKLKEKHKNLTLGVSSVVNSYNQDHLDELYELLANEMEPDDIYVLLIRQSPRDTNSKKELDIGKYEGFAKRVRDFEMKKKCTDRFSALARASQLLTSELVARTVKTNKQQLRCMAGLCSLVIDNEGGVYACECRKPVAKLRENDYDFNKIFCSEEFKKERELIKSCFCTQETQGIVPSVPFSREHKDELEEIIDRLML